MAFNFGAFAGGFSQGLNNGVQLAKTYEEGRDKRAIKDATKKGWADAEKMRQDAMAAGIGGVQEVQVEAAPGQEAVPAQDATVGRPTDGVGATPAVAGAPAVAPTMKTEYKVGDRTFASRSEAEKAATADTPDVETFFTKHAVPSIKKLYMEQGDVAKAESWDKWSSEKKGQAAIRGWSKAYSAAQRGDWDGAAAGFGRYYTDNIDDGVDYVGHTNVAGKDGTVTGFKVKLKDKKTGKVSEMELDRASMLKMGVANNPESLFKTEYAAQQAAEKARLENAQTLDKEKREFNDKVKLKELDHKSDLIKEKQKQGYTVENETTKAQRDDAKPGVTGQKIKDMRDSGLFSDDEIRAATIASSDKYKAATRPSERRALILSDLTGADPEFANRPEAEQRAKVRQYMDIIKEQADEEDSYRPEAGGIAPPRPGATAPPKSAPKGQPKPQGNYVWDSKTGEVTIDGRSGGR